MPPKIKPGTTKPLDPSRFAIPAQYIDAVNNQKVARREQERLLRQIDDAQWEADRQHRNYIQKNVTPLKKKLAPIEKKIVDPTAVRLLSYIDTHCQKFIAEMKLARKFMYHGGSYKRKKAFLGRPKLDRKPSDTNIKNQRLLDKYMAIAGFQARRGNSIFCVGDFITAQDHGDVYMIFPLDGYHYTWSTKYDDWVPDEEDFLTPYCKKIQEKEYDIAYDIESEYEFDFGYTRQFKGLNRLHAKIQAWSDKDELPFPIADEQWRVLAQEYLAIAKAHPELSRSHKFVKAIKSIPKLNVKDYAESIMKKAGLMNNARLDTALKVNHEIYICGIYVAVLLTPQIEMTFNRHYFGK